MTSSTTAVGSSDQGTPFSIVQTGLLVQAGDRILADHEDLQVHGCLP